jgi:hypothetical protein
MTKQKKLYKERAYKLGISYNDFKHEAMQVLYNITNVTGTVPDANWLKELAYKLKEK